MYIKKSHLFVLVVAFSASCVAQSERSGDKNLALNKPYSVSPTPNYSLCTDSQDTVQLTDGAADGADWVKKTTVGWTKPRQPIDITIDLQAIYGISEITISSIGGGFARVFYPEFIVLLVSFDGREYETAGFIGIPSKKIPTTDIRQKKPQVFTLASIGKNARFVKLLVRSRGWYFFADEIEVRGGERLGESLTAGGDKYAGEEYLKVIEDIDRRTEFERGLSEVDKKVVGGGLDLSAGGKEGIAKAAAGLRSEMMGSEGRYLRKAETAAAAERVGLLRANLVREYYGKPWTATGADPMAVLRKSDLPLGAEEDLIGLTMWRGEYESAAANIINGSDEPLRVSASVSALTGAEGQIIGADTTFTLRRAQYIYAAGAGYIADALVLQDERAFEVGPGEVSQLWLTVHNPDLRPGKYKARLVVAEIGGEGQDVQRETIEIEIEVLDMRFPEQAALNTCVWSYYAAGDWAETSRDLDSHHTNICVLNASEMAFPREAVRSQEEFRAPDFGRMDRALQRHSYARTFLLYLNFREKEKDYQRFGQWMTDDWQRRFSAWLKEVTEHLRAGGIYYDRWALYPFDETLCDEFYELAVLVQEIDPAIRIFANSIKEGQEQVRRFSNLVDIWCPPESESVRQPALLRLLQGWGKEVWTYNTQEPGRANDPYYYYRLMPWRAFERGQTGAGYWVYYDGVGYQDGAVAWDDTYSSLGYYGVVYAGACSPVETQGESVIPSRRWEAWREGVEDYQYLYELSRRAEQIRREYPGRAGTAQAKLRRIVTEVLGNSHSNNMYKVKAEITSAILELTKGLD